MDTHGNTTRTPTQQRGAAPLRNAPTPRISAGVKEAIRLRVEKGLTITQACAQAGISVSGWFKAHTNASVQAYHDEQQRKFIQSVDGLKAIHKARAYEVAGRFLDDDQPDANKRWAVEFFTRDDAPRKGDAPQVSVNIAQGYEFVRPGQRVVDLIDGTASDTVSGALAGDGDGTSTG